MLWKSEAFLYVEYVCLGIKDSPDKYIYIFKIFMKILATLWHYLVSHLVQFEPYVLNDILFINLIMLIIK